MEQLKRVLKVGGKVPGNRVPGKIVYIMPCMTF